MRWNASTAASTLRGVRHAVLGTAGHVDHGKTALVHALTGVHTDRLPEEQRRGITIELGFAPWRIADDLLVSIIDAPGHRRLVHTMIAGASGIDIVMLVVAADEGVMPQTREHVAACRLLGVDRAVIAVTKIDRVDDDLAELAGEEARELLEQAGIEAVVVRCSGKTGAGVEHVRDAVLAAIRDAPARDRSRRVRLSVDRVFSVKGSGTVVTGTLVEGQIALTEPLRVLGPDKERSASARSLHIHGEACERVTAPTRLAINLGGLTVDDIDRGDVITTDADVRATRVLDVVVSSGERLKRGSDASIFIGTDRSTAKIQPIAGGTADDVALALAGGRLARLRLATPMVVFGGDRFVLRGARVDGPSGAVIGGGRVLDAAPPRRGRAVKRVPLLAAIERGEAAEALLGLCREAAPRPVTGVELRSRLAVDATALLAAAPGLVKSGALAVAGDGAWVLAEALGALQQEAVDKVAEHHRSAPLDPGLRLQTLRGQLTDRAGAVVAAAVLERVARGPGPRLVIEEDTVRLPSFQGAAGNERAARALEAVGRLLKEAALQGVTENAAGAIEGVGDKQVRPVLAALVRRGDAIRAGDLWFEAAAVDALRRRIVAHLDAHAVLTIQEVKSLTGLGRKQTIPLLELFDREKVTKRQGSDRVRGSG